LSAGVGSPPPATAPLVPPAALRFGRHFYAYSLAGNRLAPKPIDAMERGCPLGKG